MTADDPNQPEPPAPATVDEETVKGWVREALAEGKPKDVSRGTSEDEPGPKTLRAIEAAAEAAMEKAMVVLREAGGKKNDPPPPTPDPDDPDPKKPEPKAPPKVKPEDPPVTKSKWREKLWA